MQYDVLIVGGGIVGLSLAALLAQNTSLSIAILEAQPLHGEWDAHSYHHRVSAIALASQRMLQSLQIWSSIQKNRVSPFSKIEVWDASSDAQIFFDSQEIAEPVLGYIIENNLIQSALYSTLKASTQVDFISPIRLQQICEYEEGIELIADDGQSFKARLAVGADGAQSWLRQQAGIEVVQHAYDQCALVATVQTEIMHQAIARQRFLAHNGVLAFLPLLEEKTSSIVWSLPAPDALDLAQLDINLFKQKLAEAFDHKLGSILEVGPRHTFKLIKQQAKQYIASRIVLIGDAAHTIHPLAGQGLNMGLLDALHLATTIKESFEQGKDIANHLNLRRYERARKAENAKMLASVDLLKCLFASEKKSIQSLRALGLNMVNKTNLLKNIFTRYAVGNV